MAEVAGPFAERSTIGETNFRGWDAIRLSNGIVSLIAVPDIGGRLMAYDLGDYPYLYVDADLAGKLFSPEENQGDGSLAAWKNYGGDKTWPSPQGWSSDDEWHGPPDPVLDSGRYSVQGMESSPEMACVTLTSPAGSSTGMQITRKITLHAGSSRVTLDLSFLNTSARARRWSIWDVCQMRAERIAADDRLQPETNCQMSMPLNPHSRFEQGFWVMFGAQDNPQWTVQRDQGLIVAKYRWEIGKIGADARRADDPQRGWIAFTNRAAGYAFAEQFQVFPGAEYPDQGSTVECWTVGRGQVANLDYEKSSIYLMEAEVLSPFYTFQPGEQRSFRIECGAARLPGVVVDAQPGGVASRLLSARSDGGRVQLSGSFGPFDAGQLILTWLDAGGEAIGSLRLEETHPRRAIELNQTHARPPGSYAVELSVVSAADGELRRLARCAIDI